MPELSASVDVEVPFHDVDAMQVAQSLNAMIDGFWIANLVTDKTGEAGQAFAKQSCLAYLHSIFPDDF